MSQDAFLPASKEVDDAVNQSTNFADMRERMLQALTKQGSIVRTRDEGVVGTAQPTPEPTAVAPTPEQNCIRVVYPSGNARHEIYGVSEADLDAQEAAIRNLYSK